MPTVPLEFAYGVVTGVALALGLYLLLRWLARRGASAPDPPEPAVPGPEVERDGPGADPSSPAFAPPVTESSATPPVIETEPSVAMPHERPEPLEATVRRPASGRSVPPTETLRLSQRVILHVYALGTVPPGETAPSGLCQAGIVEALGIPQAGLAAVLRRLEAAGILMTERGHVRGHERRLKVYRLSARGLEVARELRTRAHRRPAPMRT
ncbi:MAG TPA: MarR family winged helix-turn-helix transcriptional regulator [Thermoplasmata archaeon]